MRIWKLKQALKPALKHTSLALLGVLLAGCSGFYGVYGTEGATITRDPSNPCRFIVSDVSGRPSRFTATIDGCDPAKGFGEPRQ